MVVTITAALLTLRAGVALRRLRLRRLGSRSRGELMHRHLRLAKPTVALVLVGFVAGPFSMALLRNRDPFETAHAFLGATAALLFLTAGLLGWRLETRRSRSRDAHAAVGALALLVAATAAVAGFVLLP